MVYVMEVRSHEIGLGEALTQGGTEAIGISCRKC